MPRLTCTGCHCFLTHDEANFYPGFVVCESCDQDLLQDEEEDYEAEEWAYLNATDEDTYGG